MKPLIFVGLCFLTIALTAEPTQAQAPAVPAGQRVLAPAPLSEAAGRMKLPEGFQIQLFAGEPDVRQPIAMTIDDRGRLWVVENDSYPAWKNPNVKRKDRVIIFEDTNNDGKHDSRKVFWDQGDNLTGIELGFGGVWLCSTPNLIFLPDRNGDDQPDGQPEIILDGWDIKAEHNMFNALTWGPDGWLWGCNGIMSNSEVGKPGSAAKDRVKINCGVWRYHPTKKRFEAVAHGTTNPWGLDFDDMGEAFITNCVIPHLFHVVQGAHFQRMYGQDFHPQAYELIPSIADHIHWAGGRWQDSRGGWGLHAEKGGGHAHTGALFYLGGSWPEEYRNSALMFNIHGNRINRDIVKPKGSSYVATHAPDFLMANDVWFRGIMMRYGPDGSVFLLDWSDTDECHDTDSYGPERATGRIYKLSYGSPQKPTDLPLSKWTNEQLAEATFHKNDWYVRTARRLLQERTALGQDMKNAGDIADRFKTETASRIRIRIMWALHAMHPIETPDFMICADIDDEHVKTWAIRLILDQGPPSVKVVEKLREMAKSDKSPKVRLAIASGLPRLSETDRWSVVRELLSHGEDENDPYLPLVIWHSSGLPGLGQTQNQDELVNLVRQTKIPKLQRFLARSICEQSNQPVSEAEKLLAGLTDSDGIKRILTGVSEAIDNGKRPEKALSDGLSTELANLNDPTIREMALKVDLLAGKPAATESAFAFLKSDAKADSTIKTRTARYLVLAKHAGTGQLLLNWLNESDPTLRSFAIQNLSSYALRQTPQAVVDRYAQLTALEKSDAIATLATRPEWAMTMLKAVESGQIARKDLGVNVARQLLAMKDSKLSEKLKAVWGELRPTSQIKAQQITKYKGILTSERIAQADPRQGRQVFDRVCASCHRLFDKGGDIGPDFTGAQRDNVDYVLENVLDPSASVGRDFRLAIIEDKNGRVLSGVVKERTPSAIKLRTTNDLFVIPFNEIERLEESTTSMMPEGLFEALSDQDVINLMGYLGGKSQVEP